jgi:alkylhydroperoxidase family enzyme
LQVKNDYTSEDLTPREKKIAEFTLKVTRAADTCAPEDLQVLRDAGLGDKDILGLVELIAYYNFSTRLFESLSTIEP